jgi:hypothetical protein
MGIVAVAALGCKRRRGGVRHQDGDLTPNKVGRQHRQTLGMAVGKPVFECHVSAADIAGLIQRLMPRRQHRGL